MSSKPHTRHRALGGRQPLRQLADSKHVDGHPASSTVATIQRVRSRLPTTLAAILRCTSSAHTPDTTAKHVQQQQHVISVNISKLHHHSLQQH